MNFTVQKRGGKGVKCYKIVEKTGDVVGAKAVNDDNEIMMITTEGIIIQLRVQDISTLSRITSGVKLINLDEVLRLRRLPRYVRSFPTETMNSTILRKPWKK